MDIYDGILAKFLTDAVLYLRCAVMGILKRDFPIHPHVKVNSNPVVNLTGA